LGLSKKQKLKSQNPKEGKYNFIFLTSICPLFIIVASHSCTTTILFSAHNFDQRLSSKELSIHFSSC